MKSSPSAITPQKPFESSFRDPDGFLFEDKKGTMYRQINSSGINDYQLAKDYGLHNELIEKGLLIKHIQVEKTNQKIIIKPQKVPFISYPFEWSFSQLKDAALCTLRIQKIALKHNMVLKDASAYNIQFFKGKPTFIDTLSFEEYKEGQPWQAYKQFCQHFLAPLILMSYSDVNLQQLLRVYIDGIPLDLAAKLLPKKAKIKPSVYMHIVLHSKAQQAKASERKKPTRSVSQKNLLAIIDNLERSVKKLSLIEKNTEWGDYYNNTNYSVKTADLKANIIGTFVKGLPIKTAIDFGGNNGRYSRVLNKKNIFTICSDIDPNAVEANYLFSRDRNHEMMLPLLIDLTNPGGSLGWANTEREPIAKRLQTDLSMALALIHHLAISNNLPFNNIAQYFAKFSPYLLIEFVPKEDSQVQILLSTRKDIFDKYNEVEFIKSFNKYYNLVKQQNIKGSKRSLYLFKRK